MFELRLEERKVSTGRTGTEKILQMRTKEVHIEDSSTSVISWSEWKDIPVVQEEGLRLVSS